VYGLRPSASKGYTFVDRIIAQAKAGEHIRVVDDVIASPSYAGHIAVALRALVEQRRSGLYHLVNQGAASWYEFAEYALFAAGIDHPIEGVPQSAWFTKAARPRYSALTSNRLVSLGIEMPDWRAGIDAYLRDKAAIDVST
jgi:dTDP-4-dehydrorhamnose reductase